MPTFWSAAAYAVGSEKTGLSFHVYRLLRAAIVIPWRVLPQNRSTKALFYREGGEGRRMYRRGTHIVPAHFFEQTDRVMGLRVPGNTAEYLRFRYGDWEHPVENWSYMRDDQSFKMQSPEELGLVKRTSNIER